MTKEEWIFYIVIAVMILMVNPPVISWISKFSEVNMLTFSVPTFWLWLEVWYLVGSIAFLISAWKLPTWKKADEIEIKKGPFKKGVKT